MDLKEQKYVCTLAECKSLTRASERLYISQPALSLYINNVEKNLGAPLFERNGRKFELTWLGKQYVEKASQMLNVNLDEMNEEMDRYLREGIPDYVVVDWNRLPAEFDRYEEICALTSYDDSNRYIKSMILYRRKNDEE